MSFESSSPLVRTVCSPAGEPIISLSFEPEQGLLVARWHGYRTPELVRLGAEALLETLRKVPARGIFCDSSAVMGDWQDLLPWVEFEFLPTVTASGIQALAFLPSDETAHWLCIQMLSHLASTILPAQIHTSESAARAWLAEYVD